jgi:hypothetical protein
LSLYQIFHQSWQAIKLTVGKSHFDMNLATLDKPGIGKPLAQGSYHRNVRFSRPCAKVSDHWHRWLLCGHGKRPRDCPTNTKPDKLPPPHVPPLGSGKRTVSAQTSRLKGAKTVFAAQRKILTEVRFGSFASFCALTRHFCSTPEADVDRSARDFRFVPNRTLAAVRHLRRSRPKAASDAAALCNARPRSGRAGATGHGERQLALFRKPD